MTKWRCPPKPESYDEVRDCGLCWGTRIILYGEKEMPCTGCGGVGTRAARDAESVRLQRGARDGYRL
jgi:DnaJ-class molecular chaperone